MGVLFWEWVDGDVTNILGEVLYFAHRNDTKNGATWELDNVILKGDVVAALTSLYANEVSLFPNSAAYTFALSVVVDVVPVVSLSGKVIIAKSFLPSY